MISGSVRKNCGRRDPHHRHGGAQESPDLPGAGTRGDATVEWQRLDSFWTLAYLIPTIGTAAYRIGDVAVSSRMTSGWTEIWLSLISTFPAWAPM
ncbi:MAG: hypothetical protein P8020_02975 [Acidobacteriota bacterium]